MAPILVIRPQYDGTEKVMAINVGADEYLGWPETAGESVASGRALIRRCEGTGLKGRPFFNVLNCGEGDGTVLQTVRDVGYRIEKSKTA